MKKTVLVVEDDPLLLQPVQIVLEDEGIRALQAASEAAALEVLRGDEHIDLVLLDIMLPPGGAPREEADPIDAGIRVLRAIREDPLLQHRQRVKVLAWSVRAIDPSVSQALIQLGAEVIAKGGGPDAVLERLRRMLAD